MPPVALQGLRLGDRFGEELPFVPPVGVGPPQIDIAARL